MTKKTSYAKSNSSAASMDVGSHAGKRQRYNLAMAVWMLSFIVVLILFGGLQYFLVGSTEVLRWQAEGWLAEPWRLLTGHLVHLSVIHALFNGVALILVWQLFVADWKSRDVLLMLLSLPLCSLLLLTSSLDWYVGLSGVLHGWFLIGCVRWAEKRPMMACIAILLLLVKLWLEPLNPAGTWEADLIGGDIAYQAHRMGTLAAILLLVSAAIWDRVRARSQ